MRRGLKWVGVLAIAASALCSVGVASAAAAEFHFGAGPAVLKAKPELLAVFRFGELQLNCEQAELEGTALTSAAKEITARPTYGSCETSITVTTNDCAYVMGSETTAMEGATHGTLRIECAAGQAMEFKLASLCTIRFGEQTVGSGVHYVNKESGGFKTVTLQTTLTKISYSKSGACGSFNGEMRITAALELTAYEDLGKPQENPTTPTGTKMGKQVNVWFE